MNLPLLCDVTLAGYGIGTIILFFVGLILIVGLIYWLMGLMNSPAWLYRAAAVCGVLLLILIVVLVFFGGSGSFRGGGGDVQIRGR